jgi:hypothetical protein
MNMKVKNLHPWVSVLWVSPDRRDPSIVKAMEFPDKRVEVYREDYLREDFNDPIDCYDAIAHSHILAIKHGSTVTDMATTAQYFYDSEERYWLLDMGGHGRFWITDRERARVLEVFKEDPYSWEQKVLSLMSTCQL